MNEFGTNVDVLGSWKPSPIDLSRAEVNPNWEDVETDTEWDNQQRNPPQPANVEEEGFQETHCSPPGASRCESHPDVEIVSSAPSQLVVPLVDSVVTTRLRSRMSRTMMMRRRVARLKQTETASEAAIRGRHQGREGPLAAGGGEASETDCAKNRDLHHQSSASEEEPLDYGEGKQVSPSGSEEGPAQ